MRTALLLLLLGPCLGVAEPALAQSERYSGLWEGLLQGGQGDRALAFVLRPRGPAGLAGMVYLGGSEFGAIESGRASDDTITFSVMGFDFTATGAGDRLSVDVIVRHGKVHHLDMTHSSRDTTQAPAAAPSNITGPAAVHVKHEPPPDSVVRAHAVPAASVSTIAPCLRKGTLFLVGGGPAQPDLDRRFGELAGGARARVVVIPTASVEAADSSEMARLAAGLARNFGLSRVTVLHTLSRHDADSEPFVAQLRDATGVWILGGDANWLLDSYLGTRTERELAALLERGGVIGGTSAGAMIWGSSLMIFGDRPGAAQPSLMQPDNLIIGDPRGTGVGLLRNVMIAPHYSEFRLDPSLRKTVAALPGLLGVGIDESTALEVHGEIGRVLGRSVVTIVSGDSARAPLVLKEGARFDLVRRAAL